jgi:hypothetical protein
VGRFGSRRTSEAGNHHEYDRDRRSRLLRVIRTGRRFRDDTQKKSQNETKAEWKMVKPFLCRDRIASVIEHEWDGGTQGCGAGAKAGW